MADIKFRCPECAQKIAVEASAAGVKIDCPTCHSQLVIPPTASAPVEVTVRRRLAIVGGSADEMYADLQKAQAKAQAAADELNQVREKQTATLEEFRKDVEALRAARGALEKEAAALRPVRDELAVVKKELAAATERGAGMEAAISAAEKLRTELTGIQPRLAETQKQLAAATGQIAALQQERDEFSRAATDTAKLREQLADTQKEIARARKDAETAVSAHAAQLDAAKGLESGIRAELSATKTQHAQAETKLAEQAGKLAELEAAHQELAGLAAQLIPLRADLEKSQRELCNICESSADKTRGFEAELETARNSEAELRRNIADGQTKLAAAQKQGTDHAGRLEIAVKRVAELQSETAALKPLREQLAAAQAEVERFRNEAEKGAKKRDESAKKDDDALSKARTAEKTLREYADAMKAKLNEAEGRSVAITSGFTAIKQENADLTASLGAVRKERDDAAALATGQASEIALQKSAAEAAALEMARLRAAAEGATKEKAALASALEKATVERTESLERSRQQAAVLAANREEIERLAKLLDAADAAAKKAAPLPQPPASLKKKSDSKAVSELERQLAESLASLERTQTAEREAAERARKIDEERAGLTAELSRQSAEFDSLKGEAARVKAELDQIRSQPKETPAGPAAPSDREKSLETERDALASALERAKQHVGVLQARRDMLRDEVATLRTRLGIGGKITSGEGTPISN